MQKRSIVMSIIIYVLMGILALLVACILALKFMPDSIVAYYIRDIIENIQERLGLGV